MSKEHKEHKGIDLENIIGGYGINPIHNLKTNLGHLGGALAGGILGKSEHEHKYHKHKSSIDEAIAHEAERHKEGYRQRSEHGKY